MHSEHTLTITDAPSQSVSGCRVTLTGFEKLSETYKYGRSRNEEKYHTHIIKVKGASFTISLMTLTPF